MRESFDEFSKTDAIVFSIYVEQIENKNHESKETVTLPNNWIKLNKTVFLMRLVLDEVYSG